MFLDSESSPTANAPTVYVYLYDIGARKIDIEMRMPAGQRPLRVTDHHLGVGNAPSALVTPPSAVV